MKKALILYWHGLGDVIMLTPHLRHLYGQGYRTDLMCRVAVKESKLLNACPYVNKLIIVNNPWRSKLGFKRQAKLNLAFFHELEKSYDWARASPHRRPFLKHHKIDITSAELGLKLEDKKLEVFISRSAEIEAKKHIGGDYIFVQTILEFHKYHDWDSNKWIRMHLPPMKIVNMGYKKEYYMAFDNINISFVLAREARHRVLSSGVFVPACEAMGCMIDVINYGRPDHKVHPLDQSKILHIRESGRWIK